jgi:hypothetical protein
MRPVPLILLLSCLAVQAIGQSSDVGQQMIKAKCRTEHVSLPLSSNRPPFPPEFSTITVLDLRSDTSRIGVINDGEHRQKEVLLHAPVAKQLSSYLNTAYASPRGNHDLLVVVKNLWISESPVQADHMFSQESWDITFRFEAYLKESDRFIPLTYLDTTVTASAITSPAMVGRHIPRLIAAFMNKVATHDLAVDLMVKRSLTWGQIDSFCRTRFDYPLDTAKKWVKGVYANIDEFRNNQPSAPGYEISKDRSGDLELRIREANGQLYYTHTAWGLCDGNQLYMMMDGNLFPIFFVHHQFYVLGSKAHKNNKIPVPISLLTPGPITTTDWIHGWSTIDAGTTRSLRLFRLNPKTGDVTN